MALSLLPILVVTLMPGDAASASFDPWERICLFCGGTRGASDAILNVLLFLPFGWVLGGRRGIVRALIWGAVLSGTLEAGQLFLAGRFTSATDVLANSVGAGFGAWGATRWRGAVSLAASAAGISLLAPALLLAPAPPEGVYYGQWTAVFGNMEPYEGRVLDASVGEISVPSWRSQQTDEIRELLRTGAPVRIEVEIGPPPEGEAPIFSIFDDRQRGIFWLGAEGDDVFVRLWRIGTSLRFGTPTWWWVDALADFEVGDTVQIVYEMGTRGPCLSLQGRMRCQTATSSVGSWSLLAPGGQGDLLFLWGSLIWAFSMGIPIGMLGVSLLTRGMMALATTASVVALSAVLPYWPTPWIGLPLFLLGASAALIASEKMKVRK